MFLYDFPHVDQSIAALSRQLHYSLLFHSITSTSSFSLLSSTLLLLVLQPLKIHSVSFFSLMDIFNFFKIFTFVFLLTKSSSTNNTCTSLRCNNYSPEIIFPFKQIQVSCKQNKTVINFPNYGDLIVKSISYNPRKLNLIDPKNCVHEVFLNLNLSLTPFRYYYVLKPYKYVNCSEKLTSFEQVPCLSGSNYFVYILEPSFLVPEYCKSVKTVEIPFSYTSYLSDNSFGLGLTWISTLHSDEESRHLKKYYFKVSGVIACIFVVGMLFYATITRYSKELKGKKKLKTMFDEFLGEYEALNPTRDTSKAII